MAARAMWKGNLAIGGLRLPFKLYAAASDSGIHFRLLHAADLVPVKQEMVDPRSGEPVASEQVRRGVEVERGRFVLLDDTELERLEPPESRTVELLRFVPQAQLDPRWYERPYYLGPDEADPERYFALASALEQSGLEGIARWTMRKRQYHGSLRVHLGHLALVALRSADEVIPVGGLRAPEGRALDALERKLAKQLVDALTAEFDPDQFQDEYRDRVLELVAAKRRGKRPRLAQFRPQPVPEDAELAGRLRRSLAAVG